MRGAAKHIARHRTDLHPVGLVKPRIRLLAEQPRDALPVQVDPAISTAIYAGREVLERELVDLLEGELVVACIVEGADRVPELEWG